MSSSLAPRPAPVVSLVACIASAPYDQYLHYSILLGFLLHSGLASSLWLILTTTYISPAHHCLGLALFPLRRRIGRFHPIFDSISFIPSILGAHTTSPSLHERGHTNSLARCHLFHKPSLAITPHLAFVKSWTPETARIHFQYKSPD